MSPSSPALPPASLPASVVAAEQRAREFLAAQKWRKARDELKPLVKADRDRFLPLLVQANIGLAREMMSKGQVSEAQQVLSYLATIAPAEQLRSVELELAGQSGAGGQSLSRLAAALSDTATPLAEAERVRLADLLVLAFEPLSEGDPALVAEVKAVQDALLALSQSRWEAVTELLRAIPRRSALSHWAAFIKGLAAFYARDGEKAARCFESLPPDSVPARASRSWLLLTEPATGAPAGALPAEPMLEGTCLLAGTPGLGRPLLRAETLWKQRSHTESYRMLRDAVPAFPTPGLGPLGGLADFFFHAPYGMSEDQREDYLVFFGDLLIRGRLKSGAEDMFIRRMFALLDAAIMPAEDLRIDWEIFLRNREILKGKNPRFASLAYGWLGEQLAMQRVQRASFEHRQAELRDPSGALAVLQRSIELDPNNLQAHLALCGVHEALQQPSERNRLLDVMTTRFPDEKAVLLRAAEGCVERKAFVKGLQYLDRARQLDPLDPKLPVLTVNAHQQMARQHFQQRRPEKARQALAQAEPFLVDHPNDFDRSRWTARARHGVMERIWGEPARAEALLAEARALAPGETVGLFFIHLAQREFCHQRHAPSPWLAELKKVLPKVSRLGEVATLLQMLQYYQQANEFFGVTEEARLLELACKSALRHPFTRAEALAVIEGAPVDDVFDDAVESVVDKVLDDDAKDPQFRFLEYARFSRGWVPPEESRQKLDEILEEALRRRDDATVRKVRDELRRFDHPPPAPLPLPMPGDWAEDVEDEDFDPDFGPTGAGFPDLPPEAAVELDAMLKKLRNAPATAINELRKTRPAGMPEELFDILVQMVKFGPLMPPPPSSPPRPPLLPPLRPPVARPKPSPPAPLPPDPNQPNLF